MLIGVDILEQVAKLARAEQAVEKYQKKLEEMVELKKQNKDLCDRMDQYLDQIHSLESSNKGLGTLNKMVEQYKNRAVELETEKFEALSSVQMRDQQVCWNLYVCVLFIYLRVCTYMCVCLCSSR